MNAVAEGIDAIATTRVLIRKNESPSLNGIAVNRTFRYVVHTSEYIQSALSHSHFHQHSHCVGHSGTGAAMDIVISSVRAYIGALNKMLGFETRSKTDTPNEIKTLHTS